VLGGLAASTVITLLLIPVVYSVFFPDRASVATELRAAGK
jgi:Cu/Ag efflux pump CusA